MYLSNEDGTVVNLRDDELKAIIGKPVKYLQNADIDKSGRGYFFPRIGIIDEVYRRHIIMRHGETISISDMREIRLLPEMEVSNG